MPALYAAADAQARSAQRKFVRLQLAEIALPLIGVALGVLLPIVEPWKWLGLAASAVVAAAALLRVVERTSQVENVWYSARSCAETIKSRAWCFAVAAAPFPPELDENAATVAFIESLRAISSDFAGLEPPEPGEEISAAMRLLRESPFAIRSQSYVDGRLVDQHQWYAAKSRVRVDRGPALGCGLLRPGRGGRRCRCVPRE